MIYPALLGPFKFMPNCLVGPSECETKFSSKENWYGIRDDDSRDWGVGLQIQSYIGFYLS